MMARASLAQHPSAASLRLGHGPRARRYPNATNTEDDVAIMARALALAPDDAGNTIARATPLGLYEPFQGLVGFGGDVDVFSFQGASGRQMLVSFSLVKDYATQASQFYQRTNLDAEVTLYGAAGNVLQVWSNELNGVFSGFFLTPPLLETVSRAPGASE